MVEPFWCGACERRGGASPTPPMRPACRSARPTNGWRGIGRAASGAPRPQLGARAAVRIGLPAERVAADRAAAAAAHERPGHRPRRSACRARPSAPCCAGSASAGSPRSIPSRRSSATSAQRPGELIHIDTKKLGTDRRRRPPHHRRPARHAQQARHRLGASCMSAVDDASRLAYTEILPDEKQGERLRLPRPARWPSSPPTASPSSAS